MFRRAALLPVLFLLPLLPLSVTAQAFLAVDHARQLKRYRIYPGDELGIRLRGDRNLFRYRLEGIRGDTLFVSFADGARREQIPLESVAAVRWYRQENTSILPILGTGLQLGAVGWTAVRAINAVTSDVSPVIPRNLAIAAPSSFLLGTLLKRGNRRTFEVGRNWEVKVLDLGLRK